MRCSESFCVAALVCLLGCGGGASDAPSTVPVSGKITLGGQPLVGAKVFFVNPAHTGMGITDDMGEFTLPEGAIPGENSVYITKIEGEGSVEDAMDEGQLMAADPAALATGAPAKQLKQLVPEKYSDPEKTELSFVVSPEGNLDADFKLE